MTTSANRLAQDGCYKHREHIIGSQSHRREAFLPRFTARDYTDIEVMTERWSRIILKIVFRARYLLDGVWNGG